MPDYDAIQLVSERIRMLVGDALTEIPDPANLNPQAELTDLRPPPSGTPPTVAVFLYEVVEDPSLRNRGRNERLNGARYESAKAPLGLILRYLMVPYGGDRATEYAMLGKTLQALHQKSLLVEAELPVGLSPMEVCSVSLAPLTLEERTRVWWSISQPYRLSLNYEVRVVEIDVTADRDAEPVRRGEYDLVSMAGRP
jgi:hypothetical protein